MLDFRYWMLDVYVLFLFPEPQEMTGMLLHIKLHIVFSLICSTTHKMSFRGEAEKGMY